MSARVGGIYSGWLLNPEQAAVGNERVLDHASDVDGN